MVTRRLHTAQGTLEAFNSQREVGRLATQLSQINVRSQAQPDAFTHGEILIKIEVVYEALRISSAGNTGNGGTPTPLCLDCCCCCNCFRRRRGALVPQKRTTEGEELPVDRSVVAGSQERKRFALASDSLRELTRHGDPP